MKHIWSKHHLLILSMASLLVAMAMEYYITNHYPLAKEINKVEETLAWKKKILTERFNKTFIQIENVQNDTLDHPAFLNNPGDDIELCIYHGRELIHWTSSKVAFHPKLIRPNDNTRIRKLPTGWYYSITERRGPYRLVGFILIKKTFPHQNKYLKNEFQQDFHLADSWDIIQTKAEKERNVYDNDGTFLFSLQTEDRLNCSTDKLILPAALYFLGLIFLLLYSLSFLAKKRKVHSSVKIAITLALSFCIYLIANQLQLPEVYKHLRLYSPRHFASGAWLSSLGEFFILSILLFYIGLAFFRFIGESKSSPKNRTLIPVTFLAASIYFCLFIYLFKVLILNSDISFEFYRELRLDLPNMLSFLGLIMQLFGLMLIALKIKLLSDKKTKFTLYAIYTFSSAFAGWFFFYLLGETLPFEVLSFYLTIFLLPYLTSIENLRRYKSAFLIAFCVLSSVLFVLFLYHHIDYRNQQIQKVLSVNLASERDPAAEVFLAKLEDDIHQDSIIPTLINPPYDKLIDHIEQHFFTGFWRDYDIQITVCTPEDSLLIQPEEELHPCHQFFHERVEQSGVAIYGGNFFFMDRLNGRISYFGELIFNNSIHPEEPLSVFVDLSSKLIPEGRGYPELLLDETVTRRNRRNNFSYAKYYDGELIDRSGQYTYDFTFNHPIDPTEEFTFYKEDGFAHCVYNSSDNNFIVVSYRETTSFDLFSSFPYLFLITYLLGLIILYTNNKLLRLSSRHWDFRRKIQFAIISLLLGTILIVGSGVISYNYKQFKRAFKENMNEKIRSVSAELEMRLGNHTTLNRVPENMMAYDLIQLSDIFWVDINLFGMDGRLLATSRSDIYERGLTSKQMNPIAYHAMSAEKRSVFLHQEQLGKMDFFSAYVPLFSNSNEVLGFVNIPYFSRQSELMQQITGFIVAFLNIYILLSLISLIMALAIGNALTAPLRTIEERLRGIRLDESNEKIEYKENDEIGRLVTEYNKKVEELEESASLLARSERESAWREMARQIAHEIKNPLTPMKLSIQHLQRVHHQDNENFSFYFNRVTQTLIEQIDTLSSIATSFSNFSKMPQAHNEILTINEPLFEAARLFENNNEVTIKVYPSAENPKIWADKEQLARVFINLIKNGIQAVPKTKPAEIVMKSELRGDAVYISITDNGQGIPEKLKGKLFEPNFTTKSSGMGLGLAITKSIVTNSKGTIWFETIPENGTTFWIKFPIHQG